MTLPGGIDFNAQKGKLRQPSERHNLPRSHSKPLWLLLRLGPATLHSGPRLFFCTLTPEVSL